MSSWSPASGGWSNYIPSRQGVSKTVSGLGGVASEVYGAVSNSVPSGQGYLSSLPAGLKRLSDMLPSGDNAEHGVGDRDQVATVAFDLDAGPAKHLHFLNVCFSNGFQIWEVLDSDEQGTQATRETQPLREVVSVRQGHTHLVKMLSTVPVADESPLKNKQPAVAVVAGDEPGDLNVVRLFSLADNDYVHHMRFHGDVHSVVCNRHWMIVCLKNQLILHRMHDMTGVQTLSTFPSPTAQGVLALGPRWLAYPANQPMRLSPDDDSNRRTDPSNTYGSAYLDMGVAAASTAASGVCTLGGMGLRTLNSYLGSSPPVVQAPDQPTEYAGTVIVRDLQSDCLVHHFKAHQDPVAIIRFDPSGLLLATAAVDGHNINVFQVDTSHLQDRSKQRMVRAPKHLYKLVRGMTSAIIDDLSFSPDTRWISVTTRSRTAHLYAINGDGRHATVETHVPSPSIDAAWPLYPSSASYEASNDTPITLFAVQRIKQREHLPASVMARTLSSNKASSMVALASSCTRFAIPGNTTTFSQFPAATGGIFMVTGEGAGVVMASYQLSPFCKEDPDTLAQTLFLDVDCQGTMDICRRRSWREQECNAQRLSSWTKAAAENAKPLEGEDGSMPEWVSNVEIYTHERSEDAVWGSSKIRFKSFNKSDVPLASGPPAFIEQVQTTLVRGSAVEMDDADSQDYFFVQGPGPRTGCKTVSPHTCSMFPPAAPDVLHLHAPEGSPGVYGGLPSSFGSSKGTPPIDENSVHAQGREPCGAGSYGSNSRGTRGALVGGSGYGYRSSDEEAAAFSKAAKAADDDKEHEEGLFEMDDGWDSDGDWEGTGSGSMQASAGADKKGEGVSAGLAASSMLFDDDNLRDTNVFSDGDGDAGAANVRTPAGACEVRAATTAPVPTPTKNAIECLKPSASSSSNRSTLAAAGNNGSRECVDAGLSEREEWEREAEAGGGYRDDKDSAYSKHEAARGWDSDDKNDKYDGDGSAKGDNDTPINSFSPSRGMEALKDMKKLHLQLHPDGSSSPEDDDSDAWGSPTTKVRSAKKPLRSPSKGVDMAQNAQQEVGPNQILALGSVDSDAKLTHQVSSTPPESSDPEGPSSGLESTEKESGADEPSSSAAKKKKKKKSKK